MSPEAMKARIKKLEGDVLNLENVRQLHCLHGLQETSFQIGQAERQKENKNGAS